MGTKALDEAAAAPGLQTAVEFYSAKADALIGRQADLEAELATIRTDVVRFSSTRDQLAEALAGILADNPEPTAADEASEDRVKNPGASADESTGDPSPSDTPAAQEQTPQDTSKSGSGELMQAVEQILVTAGRPLVARDITEALGRPTKGKAGRAPIETTRRTCKRLVKNGRAVENPVGVFTAVRAQETLREAA
ncbi:hypothetical protein [Streptomyces sp. AK02-01A]|uniref:hypothetical protein n=1 Tax=Streptomyces sp. AK02-01A TaxID=3028648 RepID=UPI0029B15000|nr:hypothetical protein [Streptomyces sp. AK02-01A]MDX3854167.1 hypothetical protein [Streptomyces sp. AK02-01A]